MTKLHGGAIVDIGNVIIAYWLSKLTSKNYHTYPFDTIPEEPGAFDGLHKLNEMFGGNVTIVWKATDDAVGKNMRWLELHRFCERTGIPMAHIERMIGEDRAAKTHYIHQSSQTHEGTTVVIDDRLEVLSHFVGKVPHLFLFRFQLRELVQLRQQGRLDRVLKTGVMDHVHFVESWSEIMQILNNT
jgi:hypothetical protein